MNEGSVSKKFNESEWKLRNIYKFTLTNRINQYKIQFYVNNSIPLAITHPIKSQFKRQEKKQPNDFNNWVLMKRISHNSLLDRAVDIDREVVDLDREVLDLVPEMEEDFQQD